MIQLKKCLENEAVFKKEGLVFAANCNVVLFKGR